MSNQFSYVCIYVLNEYLKWLNIKKFMCYKINMNTKNIYVTNYPHGYTKSQPFDQN